MISIQKIEEGLPYYQALSSDVRLKILTLVAAENGITTKQIAEELQMPVTTLVPHIKILQNCQLIFTPPVSSPHAPQKYYFNQNADQFSISLDMQNRLSSVYSAEVPVGHYGSFSVAPTCGLSTVQFMIGKPDEPRYFAHPDRYQSEILWFTTGYVEYILPNFIPINSAIDSVSVSFEISSEAPNYNNHWPSEITFFLNDTRLGTWISPGDYGDRRGRLNPDWWYPFLNQYGLLKKLTVGETGTYLDDELLSPVCARDLNLTDQSILRLRFSVLPGPKARGCTLYGRGFGDHAQGLITEIMFHPNTR